VHNLFLDDGAAQYLGEYWRSRPSFNSYACIALGVHFAWAAPYLIEKYKSANFRIEAPDFPLEFRALAYDYLRRIFIPAAILSSIIAIGVLSAHYARSDTLDIRFEQIRFGLLGFVLGTILIVLVSLVSVYLSSISRLKPSITFFAAFYAIITVALVWVKLIPAVSLFLLLSIIALIYFVVKAFPLSARLPAVAGIVLVLILINRFTKPLTFPGLEGYSDVHVDYEASNTDQGIDPVQALNAWRSRFGEKKPKLVLVATSGGAYRASFWTASILDQIVSRSRPDGATAGLADNIRLLTGASGGMVASAYFSATYPATPGRNPPSITETLTRDIKDGQGPEATRYWSKFPIPRDSLSPLSQHFIQKDIFRLFLPIGNKEDRGRVLEESWRSLHVPVGSLADAERSGLRPSLILSPVFVETGAPLYISNLNLGELITKSSGAREFFKMFPDSRSSFRLSTAVRMNATFPYISPIVHLPTRQTRSLVDAGYYDNYGISLATSYLSSPSIMKWIKENTSGVMVIQIRAFRTEAPISTNHASWTNCAGNVENDDNPGSFFWLTGPLEGVASSRSRSMHVRNDQELALIKKLYGQDFVQTIAFENTAQASLSWYVPEREMKCIRGELKSDYNEEAFGRLQEWWTAPDK
jgi:hypothetical protein